MSSSIISINAKYISWAHTICASSAFISALIVGVCLHYHKIVENGYYGYPDEWFPSVSATIGDRYPERSIFQILIALTSGPRFLLLLMSYIRLYDENRKRFGIFGVVCGIIRTVTCGGWVYITSTDDHDAHDVFMISYIVLTIPWEFYVISSTPKRTSLRKYRTWTSLTFFAMLVPLIYFFIQHKVHRVAGAYSIYAYFEWALIIFDIAFDAWTTVDFQDLTITLSTTKPISFSIDKTTTTVVDEVTENTDLKLKTRDEIPFLEIILNIINSFIFWSVITSLLTTIWFFPLWNMGISGFELTILSFLFSFLLIIPPIKKTFASYPQAPRLLTVLFGIGSYKIEDPDTRLLSIAVGSAFAAIALSNEIHHYGSNNTRSKYYSTSFTLGLLLSSIAKFSNYTNNPIWPIMHYENGGWNKTGVIVGVIAAILTPKVNHVTQINSGKNKFGLITTGLGLGGLLFSLHAMLTDSSTIIIWNWEGYPINGPTPVPHGAITLIIMGIGAYLGLTTDINTKIVSIVGILTSIILYICTEWIGYIGGLGYTLFLTSIIPLFFNNAAKYQPGVIFPLAFFVHIVLMLAHVWIVAYAFVPGGWILRERTDIVLGSSTALIILGLLTNGNVELKTVNYKSALYKIKRIIITFSILSVMIAYLRFPKTDPTPYHPNSKLITAGIWTIHFGLDNDMWASEGRMINLIRELELDVVGLLETDTQRIIMGNRDLTQQMGEELGMYVDYGPGPNKHTWGCALLSKFPILNSTHHLLPSPVGELAPAIHATLDVYGEWVDIVVFHSGQEEDEEDRYLQSLGIRDIMGSTNRPMILLSYLVTNPLEGNYNNYVSEESGMHDIDPSDWDRWCQYILYKNLKRTGYARISRSTITDTELQVGKFQLPNNVEEATEYSQEKIKEKKVSKDLRFPKCFAGDGVRGHRYHVFDEPRYYK